MEMTREQFLNQNKIWYDKNYWYAIHITDGGAMYLYQVDKNEFNNKNDNEKINICWICRIDGMDFVRFADNIQNQIEKKLR